MNKVNGAMRPEVYDIMCRGAYMRHSASHHADGIAGAVFIGACIASAGVWMLHSFGAAVACCGFGLVAAGFARAVAVRRGATD